MLGTLQTRPSFNSYNILSIQLEVITILLQIKSTLRQFPQLVNGRTRIWTQARLAPKPMLLLLCSAEEPKVSIGEQQTGGMRVRNWWEGTHTVVGLVYQADCPCEEGRESHPNNFVLFSLTLFLLIKGSDARNCVSGLLFWWQITRLAVAGLEKDSSGLEGSAGRNVWFRARVRDVHVSTLVPGMQSMSLTWRGRPGGGAALGKRILTLTAGLDGGDV